MADWYNYEITLYGKTDDVGPIVGELQVQDTPDGSLNTPDLRIEVADWDDWMDPDGKRTFVFSGQCAYDDAETLVNRLRRQYEDTVRVDGMMQGGWDPI